MANLHILTKDWVSDATFSGGSWEATLPLTNLKNQQPTKIARSTNDSTASTLFVADIGRVAPVSMFALINHNLSADATIRFRLSTASNLSNPTIDATVDAIIANIVFGSQPWGAFPWTGIGSDVLPGGLVSFYQHTSSEFGQYIGVNITDTGNPDSYVQIGVFKAGDPIIPSINMSYGARLKFIDPSRQSRTVGGQKYFDVKPKYRQFAAELSWMTEAEAIGSIFDMQNLRGISGGLFMIYDPDDADEIILRRAIHGTLISLDDIVTANQTPAYPYSYQIAVEELI